MKNITVYVVILLSCLFIFAQQTKSKNTKKVNNDISQTVSADYFGLEINEFHMVTNENDSLHVLDLTGDHLPELVRIINDTVFIHTNISGKLTKQPVIIKLLDNYTGFENKQAKTGGEELLLKCKNKNILINGNWYFKHLNTNAPNSKSDNIFKEAMDFGLVYQGPGIDTTDGKFIRISDIDNDNKIEVIYFYRVDKVNHIKDYFAIYERQQNDNYILQQEILIDTSQWGGTYIEHFIIDDIDNNGYKEIIFCMAKRIYLYEYTGNNNFHFYSTNISYRYAFGGGGWCEGIEVVDFDRDGKKELLCLFSSTQTAGTPYYCWIQLNEFIFKYPGSNNMAFNLYSDYKGGGYVYGIKSGDLDNDGYVEVLLSDIGLTLPQPDDFFYLKFNHNNNTFTLKSSTSGYPGGPGFGLIEDVDRDNLNELVISGPGNGNGTFFIMEATGPDQLVLVQHDSVSLDFGPYVITSGKIDGQYSILLSESDGTLMHSSAIIHIKQNLTGLFEDVWESQRFDSTYVHTLYLKDIDLDNKENLIFAGNRIGWYQFNMYDMEKTTLSGFNDPDIIVNEFRLLQNYPNPFNSDTIIQFYTKTTSDVILKIFNITGKLIFKKNIDNVIPGLNQYKWKAKSDLSSGIYFYSIKQGHNTSRVQKAIYLK